MVVLLAWCSSIFFFNDTATTEIYTRSLVGSVKMCIRDRAACQVLQDAAMIFHGQPAMQAQSFSGDFVSHIGAVSYTHLRAHETVLDLVCRLLLEKKNSITDKTQMKYSYRANNNKLHVITKQRLRGENT